MKMYGNLTCFVKYDNEKYVYFVLFYFILLYFNILIELNNEALGH